MRKALRIALAAPVFILACRRQKPDSGVAMVSGHSVAPPAATAVSAGGDVAIAGIAFRVPEQWQAQTPESPMRAAQYAIRGADHEKPGSFAVFFFGSGQGGSVEMNAQRWQAQFSQTDGGLEKRTAGGMTVTIVRAEGTYSSGVPMGGPSAPEPNFALWGAIIEGPQGNVFLKATGPKATIARTQADFDRLLGTIHRAGASF